jgi:ZIP zinc transporter
MSALVLTIILGLTAAMADGVGGLIIIQRHWERRYLRYFMAVGSGFMLATALVEMLPESLRIAPKHAPAFLLLGYFLVHFFEHTVTAHFHFGEETHVGEFIHSHKTYSVLLGLVVHTFFDGIAIASGFLISNWLGWVIFVAVFLHKIPTLGGCHALRGCLRFDSRSEQRAGHTDGSAGLRRCRRVAVARQLDSRLAACWQGGTTIASFSSSSFTD